MYGIFTYISHKSQPNLGKYTLHSAHLGLSFAQFLSCELTERRFGFEETEGCSICYSQSYARYQNTLINLLETPET